MRSLLPSLLGLALLIACAPGRPTPETEDVGERDDGALSGTTDGLKIVVHEDAKIELRDGAQVLVVTGSTSRNLDAVSSARAFGGAFGQASKVGPKSFEIVFTAQAEVDEVLRGTPVQLAVRTKTGAVRDFTAELRVAPSYEKFTGATGIFVRAEIEPVYAGGFADRTRFRSTFSTPAGATNVSVSSQSNGVVVPFAQAPNDWTFDRTTSSLLAELDKKTDRTTFKASVSQQLSTKKAAAVAKVVELAVTSDDPAEAFPAPACDANVSACVEASLTSGDVSACGDYLEVTTCLASPRSCLFGWTLEQALSGSGFGNTGFGLIEDAAVLSPELSAKVIAAAKERDATISTLAEALALGAFEHTEFQRVATGEPFDALTVTVGGMKYGAIFEADGSARVASVQNSFLGACTLVGATGGAQAGEDCNDGLVCGADLTCLGQNPAVGFGKCVPNEAPAGTGEACGVVGGQPTDCASQALVCGGLTGTIEEGICVPTWLRGQFDDWDVTPLPPTGTLERGIEAYGLATVAMDAGVYVEVVNIVPSKIVVKLRNPAGTESTLWDGPAIGLAEPQIDGDNFIEIAATADSFPGDESANGTYTLVVESLPGNDPGGEVSDWHLTVTSRFD
jgi:hypothetical protein